jgi:hypothetical protein
MITAGSPLGQGHEGRRRISVISRNPFRAPLEFTCPADIQSVFSMSSPLRVHGRRPAPQCSGQGTSGQTCRHTSKSSLFHGLHSIWVPVSENLTRQSNYWAYDSSLFTINRQKPPARLQRSPPIVQIMLIYSILANKFSREFKAFRTKSRH